MKRRNILQDCEACLYSISAFKYYIYSFVAFSLILYITDHLLQKSKYDLKQMIN